MTRSLQSHSNTPLTDQEQTLFDISEKVLDHARQQNCTAAELSISQLSGAEYSVRNGEPETIERNQDKGLNIRVFSGDQVGSAATTDFSPEAIAATVKAASSIARVTEGDPCQHLAEAQLYPQEFPDLELYHPHSMSVSELGKFALEQAIECEAAALDSDARISNSEGASYSAHESVALSRNSNGFSGFSRSTRYGLSCSVIAGENDTMQRDYWYDSSRKLGSMETAVSIGKTAAERACRRLQARKIGTCRAPVIVDASIAPGMIRHLVSALSGNAVYKKASFLSDRLGETLFPEEITIGQHPHIRQGMGSSLYDNDGVATREQNYIEQGRLNSYVLSQYSACKLGMQTTGNAGGVNNLTISHEDISLSDLMQRMQRGLLVTEMMGFGVNTVTGDYSRGAAGFWVENGEIQYPVHEITLSGHLLEMFKGFSGVANDTNKKGNIQSGSILINEMTIAGN